MADSWDPLDTWRVLSNTWKRWRRLAERNLESLGLSVTEFRVLNRLGGGGPSPMVRLAQDQGLTRSSMTSIMDHLEAQGLARRVRSREDRRVITIRISPRGQALLRKALDAHRAFVRDAMRSLSPGEVAALVRSFQRIAQSLE